MGSFNVACSASNLSIDAGMPIVYIPLEKAKYPYKIGDGNDFLIYSRCFYAPVTLPIFGIYGDYGLIERIEACKNINIIESYFKTTTEKICDPQTHTVKPISSGMFVLREVYELFVKHCTDDFGKPYLPRKKLKVDLEQMREKVKKNQRDFAKFGIRVDMWLNVYSYFAFRDYKTFPKIYMDHLLDGGLDRELIDFARFEAGFYSTNRFYFPAMNGWQHGNKYMDVKLHRLATKIANRQIKRWEHDT